MTRPDTIKVGGKFPNLPTWRVQETGGKSINTLEWFGKGRTVLFTLPGAFTPTCHIHHLPGYVKNHDKFAALGISRIICASVNDHYVMHAWAKAQNAFAKVEFLADFDASLAKALGLEKDLSAGGLGVRFKRSAIILQDGHIEAIFVDDNPGKLTISSAEHILGALTS